MSPNSKHAIPEPVSWPDATQLLLLRACLGSGRDVVDAWRAWKEKVAFDDLDYASMRLIPMLHHNLRALGVDDPDLGRYRGLSRRSWYVNQLLFQVAASVLKTFHGAGIRTLVLKGVPLAHLYYPEIGLRPMSDFDVLVPPDQAGRAILLLESTGWKADESPVLKLRLQPGCFLRGWNFSNAARDKLDLHWRLLETSLAPDADESFWAGAEPFSLCGVETLTLNAADHLLHTCLHGLPANCVAPMRWVVDAMMIARKREIDRERLLAHVRKHRASVMMSRALAYLCGNFQASMLDSVRQSIAQIPSEPWEHAEFAAIVRPGNIARRAHGFLSNFRRMRCTTPFLAERSPFVAYAVYLRLRWGLGRIREIPGYVVRRILGQMAATFRRSQSPAAAGASPRSKPASVTSTPRMTA